MMTDADRTQLRSAALHLAEARMTLALLPTPADIACCRERNSLNVVFANECIDGSHQYYYFCCDCGHITPDRPALKDADQAVEWIDSHEMRGR